MNFLTSFAYSVKTVVVNTVKFVGSCLNMAMDFAIRCIPLFCLVSVFMAASFTIDLALPALAAAGAGFLVQAGVVFTILWVACEVVSTWTSTGKNVQCEI